MTSRASSVLLVAIAILVVMGHICAGPLHAHAGTVTTHSEDHPEGGSDEAAHGGSCETLRADFNFHAPALIQTSTALPVAPNIELYPMYAAPAAVPASSPPLFLLHASLLI